MFTWIGHGVIIKSFAVVKRIVDHDILSLINSKVVLFWLPLLWLVLHILHLS